MVSFYIAYIKTISSLDDEGYEPEEAEFSEEEAEIPAELEVIPEEVGFDFDAALTAEELAALQAAVAKQEIDLETDKESEVLEEENQLDEDTPAEE
jgi:hypothetical protein